MTTSLIVCRSHFYHQTSWERLVHCFLLVWVAGPRFSSRTFPEASNCLRWFTDFPECIAHNCSPNTSRYWTFLLYRAPLFSLKDRRSAGPVQRSLGKSVMGWISFPRGLQVGFSCSSNSSWFIGSDLHDQPSLPTCNMGPWLLSPVHHHSYLGANPIGRTTVGWESAQRSRSFGDEGKTQGVHLTSHGL